jgi:prepilin-type N-terminal cleavage/methylation domain-containing protein
MPRSGPRRARGFTLTELAVVFAIISLLLAAGMYTLAAQTEQRNLEETRRRLEAARELIFGFAFVNGRLPCPASSTSNGVESPVGGACAAYYSGFLPAKSIGYQITDASGYALDAYNNRIRYALSSVGPSNHFSNAVSLRQNGITTLPNDLVVCAAWGGSTANCGTAASVTNQNILVAVIWSQGKNFAAVGAGGVDETANNKIGPPAAPQNNHPVFVWHPPTPAGATGGEFDDQMTWITAGELYAKLIAAGLLP